MSDNFIPLTQSSPLQGKWNNRNQNQRYHNNRYHNNSSRRGSFNHYNRWGNNSHRNSSYGSDSNNSYGQDNRSSIDAYLHPSMLEDPWAHLRQKKD